MAASDLISQVIGIIASHRAQIRDLFVQETPFEDGVLPIEGGGTGATSASAARSALGVGDASSITSGTLAAARLGASPASTKLLFGDNTWSTLAASDIPSLDASKITTGSFSAGRLGSGSPSASTVLFGDSTWATLAASDIPSLDASKITSGTFDEARLGTGTAASSNFLRGDGTWTNSLSGTFSCSTINTGGPAWDLGAYTAAGDAAMNGYVSVTIGGTAYKFATRA